MLSAFIQTSLLTLLSLHAYNIPLQEPHWKVREFHAPHDLPYERVRHIIEGENGAIWMATWGGGVACMHGNQLIVYDLQSGLLSNHTRKLAIDRFGGIWATTTKGLNYIHPNGEIYSITQENLPGSTNANFLSIAIDEQGTVWAGGYDFHLFTISLKPNVQNQSQQNSISEFPYQQEGIRHPVGGLDVAETALDGIEDIAIDREGNTWLGVNLFGIVKISPEDEVQSWSDFKVIGPESPSIYDVALHPKAGIYAGIDTNLYHITEINGLEYKKTRNIYRAIYPYKEFLIEGTTVGLYVDVPYKHVAEHREFVQLGDSGQRIYVECITEMSDGSIWVSTKSGVYRFSPSLWQESSFIKNDKIETDIVSLSQNTSKKTLLLSSDFNILQKVDGQLKIVGDLLDDQSAQFSENLTQPESDISSQSDKEEGDVFYALFPQRYSPNFETFNQKYVGIYKIQMTPNAALQVKKLPHVPRHSHYMQTSHKLYHPENDELWLLYHDGAVRWNGEEWVKQPQLTERNNRFVYSMIKTASDTYWFGGVGWVERWQDGRGELLELPESSKSNPTRITDMIERGGKIWLATMGNGLLVYDRGRWEPITNEQGMPAEDATALLNASDNTLWVGLQSGSILSYKNNRWIQYGLADGLPNRYIASIHEDAAGDIIASYYWRMSIYHPEALPPDIQLESMTETLLPNERGFFSVFAQDAWKDTPASELVYSWRIVDEAQNQPLSEWSPYQPKRVITTQRLQPGTYRFEVQAQDKSRNTSAPAMARFAVTPYFWTTPAFLIPVNSSILIALAVLGLWARNYYKLRRSQLKYRNLLDKDAATLVLNWDMQGNLLYCNDHARRLYSAIQPNFKKHPVSEWFCNHAPEQQRLFEQTIQHAVQNPESSQSCRIKHQQDGRDIWISWFIRATWPATKTKMEIHAVGIDVSRQINVEEKLEQEKMSFREFCDSAHVGIVRFNESNQIVYMNPAMQQLIQADSAASHYPPLHHWANEQAWVDLLNRVRQEQTSLSASLQGWRLNSAEPFHAIVSATTNPPFIDMMVLDYTEQHRMQEKIAITSQHEQEKIGRELHDGLSQHLSALVYMGKRLEKQVEGKHDELMELVNDINRKLVAASEQSRVVSRGLNPMTLHKVGLREALNELLSGYRDSYSTVLILHYTDEFRVNTPKEAEIIYRIVREAVFNALKHAKANTITVTCRHETGRRTVIIQDDGRGMPIDPKQSKGMGCTIMQYHAERTEAELRWETPDEGGTRVVLPLKPIG